MSILFVTFIKRILKNSEKKGTKAIVVEENAGF